MAKLTLKVEDGQQSVVVPFELQGMSPALKNALEDFAPENEEEDQKDVELEYKDIKKAPLEKLVAYCTHFEFKKERDPNEFDKPLKSADPEKFIKDEWTRNWVKENADTYDEKTALMFTAHKLEVGALYQLMCACIAAYYKGKSVEQLKEIHGLGNSVDYTPETEEQLRKDYGWIFEKAEAKLKNIRDAITAKEKK